MTDGLIALHGRKAIQDGKKAISAKNFQALHEQALQQKAVFENALKEFAAKNSKKIKEDPVFRAQFNEMCLTLNVDPLQSRNGFWTKILKIGNFYHELAIKTIEVSFRLKHTSGGMIPIQKIIELVTKTYANKISITSSDIKTAINGLDEIGEGYAVKKINKKEYFIMDMAISDDPQSIIEKANDEGIITKKDLDSLHWDQDRLKKSIDTLHKRGIIWIDRVSPTEIRYYVFSMFKGFA